MSAPGPPSVRALLLDAGNTLLRMAYGPIADRLSGLGVPVTPGKVERAEWRARVRLDDEYLAMPRPDRSTESQQTGLRYLALVLEELGVSDAAVVEAMEAWRRGYNAPAGLWHAPMPGASQALDLARRAGLRTGVISNSNGLVGAILEMLGLGARLDFVLDSGEVGVEKPDPRIFGLALARAGVAAEEAVHVGDLYSVDVRGARGAGIAVVLLDPGGHWGVRDCATAPDVLAAVRLVAGAQAGSVTNG